MISLHKSWWSEQPAAPLQARSRRLPPQRPPLALGSFVLPDERCYLYLIILPIFCFVYAKFVVPRYKHKHVLVYLVLCAAIGSLTVTSARCVHHLLACSCTRSLRVRVRVRPSAHAWLPCLQRAPSDALWRLAAQVVLVAADGRARHGHPI